MKYVPLVLILLFCSCSPESTIRDTGAETLNKVAANNDAVADRVEPNNPSDAAVLRLGANTVNSVLELTANKEMREKLKTLAIQYGSKVEQIKKDLQTDAQKYVHDLNKQYSNSLAKVKEESVPWYMSVLGIVGSASVLGLVLRSAISIFGGPAWVVTAVNAIAGVSNAAKKIKQAHDTVGAAEAGREALRQLDEQFGKELKDIGIDSVEGLFKRASKSWALDKKVHTGVHTVVKSVRNEIETKDGRPV